MRFGKGQEVVFLHGWGGSITSFIGVANMLKNDCTVTLIDLYGFGKSVPVEKPLTVSDYAYGVKEILNKYEMENVVLVAHSFGGRIAMELVANYPHFFSKLILVDSAGVKPKRGLNYYYKILKYKIFKKLKLSTENFGSKDYQELTPVMKQTFVNVVNYDQSYLLNKIIVPTLIIWGKNDTETPLYMAKKLKKNIIYSELIIFENCGHFAYLEDRYKFYLILSSFILGR